MFSNIPDEMKQYRQWIVWRFEDLEAKKPTKVPYSPKTHKRVSVQDSVNWGTFDECVAILNQPNNQYSGLGFVLTKNDPYTFIDLDDASGDQVAMDRQQAIYNHFQSYAETSPSGTGCHVIVKGWIPSGRRRSKIEIYSDARFMTMTGNVNRNLPIVDFNDHINALYKDMGEGSTDAAAMHGDSAQTMEDDDVMSMASNAVNGEKFNDLYSGDWQKHYESQSEADMALVNIIAFYTQNREQIVRMFRDSNLGQREKAKRNDYVKYMLAKCFDKMLPPLDLDGLRNRIDAFFAESASPKESELTEHIEPDDYKVATAQEVAQLIGNRKVYSMPPGLMGEIALHIYNNAQRQVPEVALAGALGLMAGITGRAFNTHTGSGLNTYTLLIAKTGRGKEAIANGIGKLMKAVQRLMPSATSFEGPSKIASEGALLRQLGRSNSFLSIFGEFGITLRNMSRENASPHLDMLKGTMLDLYNKSGHNQFLRPSVFADSDKDTKEIQSPNFSLIGESSPIRFYPSLNEEMIQEGLLSRFTIIEYNGLRLDANSSADGYQPPEALVQKVAELCAVANALNVQNRAIKVKLDSEAEYILDQFDKYCTKQINQAEQTGDATLEILAELWNRAHLKALRISAQIAVGCAKSFIDPVVNAEAANWAINLVVEDVRSITEKFRSGDVDSTDTETAQINKMKGAFRDYMIEPWEKIQKYTEDKFSTMHAERYVTHTYISKRLTGVACFRKDRNGAAKAIKATLRTLIERGDIEEVARKTTVEKFQCRALCYVVVNPAILR